jgi:bifunctional DNA-binding transcriptional regulator/antitoxin component of YhaV-PrlF toxin-antitoxin module
MGMTVMALAKLQERGQFTVPAKLREAVGLKPGVTLLLRAVGPGRFEAVALPNHSLSAFFGERVAGEVSLDRLREAMGHEMTAGHAPEAEAAWREAAAARLG